VEVVQETEGIDIFKASSNHKWIQAARDPKKAWLEMKYCVTSEEIDWIIKDWPTQWKILVGKLSKNPVITQSTKPKG